LTKLTENADAVASSQRVTSYIWDASNRLANSTISGEVSATYTYTSGGRVASIATKNLTANGVPNQTHTVTYTYTTYSSGIPQKLVVTGPVPGQTVTYNYSSTGDLTSVVNALGQTTTYANYNALGQPGTVTDPNGAVTTYTYDPRGRVATVSRTVNGTGQVTKTAYNALGQVTDTWLPDGRHLTNVYDAAYRLTSSSELESSTPDVDAPNENDTSTRILDYTYDANADVTNIAAKRVLRFWYIEEPCDPLSMQAETTGTASSSASLSPDGTMQPMSPPGARPCRPRRPPRASRKPSPTTNWASRSSLRAITASTSPAPTTSTATSFRSPMR
jgi:YD repeat-containing protein